MGAGETVICVNAALQAALQDSFPDVPIISPAQTQRLHNYGFMYQPGIDAAALKQGLMECEKEGLVYIDHATKLSGDIDMKNMDTKTLTHYIDMMEHGTGAGLDRHILAGILHRAIRLKEHHPAHFFADNNWDVIVFKETNRARCQVAFFRLGPVVDTTHSLFFFGWGRKVMQTHFLCYSIHGTPASLGNKE